MMKSYKHTDMESIGVIEFVTQVWEWNKVHFGCTDCNKARESKKRRRWEDEEKNTETIVALARR